MKKRAQISLFCLYAALILVTCLDARSDQQIRQPAVAGQFYPAQADELARFITEKFDAAEKKDIPGRAIGLVVPHAGYNYSGGVAAAGYKQVAGLSPDRIIILGPSHHEYFQGASIYPGAAYATPLGNLKIDQTLAKKLARNKWIALSEKGHGAEHSVEVQLPFVQTLFPDTPIIPMVIGAYDWQMCREIGQAVADAVKKRSVLLIASTDLYHGESYSQCKQISSRTLEAIRALQPQALCQKLLTNEAQACGGGPVVIMEVAAKALGANGALLIQQTNSNDVTGQRGGYVVGYGSVLLYENGEQQNESHVEFPPLPLPVQKEMLRMARRSIEAYLSNRRIPEFEPRFDELNDRRGLFVTLTMDGRLRGCIGHHESDVPLYKLLPQMAVAAAFGDPRFPPLQKDELDRIKIKVSVYLTHVYPIADLSEFKMGVHGIIMKKNGHAATYLPEVPTEAGWTTLEEEMASLSLKAGLAADAWKKDAQFWLYRTQIFDESILK